MTRRRKNQGDPKSDRQDEGQEENTFADLIGELDDLERLDSDQRRGPYRPDPSARTESPDLRAERSPEPMQFPKNHERLLARRPHLSPARFQRLCAGRIAPGQTLDLHGHDRNSARVTLFRTLKAAAAQRVECVLVIHGQGKRSETGQAILRDAMPGWLTDPELRQHILGFAPAQPQHGGRGAVYVLLS